MNPNRTPPGHPTHRTWIKLGLVYKETPISHQLGSNRRHGWFTIGDTQLVATMGRRRWVLGTWTWSICVRYFMVWWLTRLRTMCPSSLSPQVKPTPSINWTSFSSSLLVVGRRSAETYLVKQEFWYQISFIGYGRIELVVNFNFNGTRNPSLPSKPGLMTLWVLLVLPQKPFVDAPYLN